MLLANLITDKLVIQHNASRVITSTLGVADVAPLVKVNLVGDGRVKVTQGVQFDSRFPEGRQRIYLLLRLTQNLIVNVADATDNEILGTLVVFKGFTGCRDRNRADRNVNDNVTLVQNVLAVIYPSQSVKVDRIRNIAHTNDRGLSLPVRLRLSRDSENVTREHHGQIVEILNGRDNSTVATDKVRAWGKVAVEHRSSLVELANVRSLYRNLNLNAILFGGRLGVFLANLTDVGFVKVCGVESLDPVEIRGDAEGVAVGKGRLGTQTKSAVEIVGRILGRCAVGGVDVHHRLFRQTHAKVTHLENRGQSRRQGNEQLAVRSASKNVTVPAVGRILTNHGKNLVGVDVGTENRENLGRIFDGVGSLDSIADGGYVADGSFSNHSYTFQ